MLHIIFGLEQSISAWQWAAIIFSYIHKNVSAAETVDLACAIHNGQQSLYPRDTVIPPKKQN